MSTERNQLVITIDSCRWDVFRDAPQLWMKRFPHSPAFTHGTYTLPAHMSFMVASKFPNTYDGGEFDTCARINRHGTVRPVPWRIVCPESRWPVGIQLPESRNVVDGFNKLGWHTIGTGAVTWFDPKYPSSLPFIHDFQKYGWFGLPWRHAREQVDFMLGHAVRKPFFGFINFGETHAPFKYNERHAYPDKEVWSKSTDELLALQTECLQFLDMEIKRLLTNPIMKNTDVIVCADHGDCFGEDGLYGHSFFHEKVITVPIVKIRT